MNRRGVIVTAWVEGDLAELYSPAEGDLLLCADGGYELALERGLCPQVYLGDGDSSHSPSVVTGTQQIAVPVEKDETDTLLCLRYAVRSGCREILLLGGIGGRLDHTLANLQAMAEIAPQVERISMEDACHKVFFLENGTLRFPRKDGWHLSLLSFSPRCVGVSASGVKYPLAEAELRNSFPLGVSNEFQGEEAVVTCKEGQLLVILSRDPA